MTLPVELQVFWDWRAGNLTNSGKPVDGSGGGVDDGVRLNLRWPVGYAGGVNGAVP